MHYAVPTLLERAQMLRHFYTDAVGNIGLTGVLGDVLPRSLCPAPLRRLFARKIPTEVPPDRVTTVQGHALRDGVLKRIGSGDTGRWSASAPRALRRRMTIENFRGANALYCLDNGDEPLMLAAKRRGMTIVYEQVIAPQVGRILREERARYPGLEKQEPEEFVEEGIRRDNEVWKLADLVLAPSEFVRAGMIELGADPNVIRLVPYGLPERWYGATSQPVPGRILFVGSVGLRKGSHYFAEAYRILRQRGVNVEFRVVGPYQDRQISSPLFTGPDYIGQVPRDVVQKEFAQADIFALPTLAEGFALVHLEAMACGVPVVTTPNCGPAVRDGQEGFIVPARDATALADRLQTIITDRALRNRMGENARTRAADFSWTNYRDRLLAALSTIKPNVGARSS